MTRFVKAALGVTGAFALPTIGSELEQLAACAASEPNFQMFEAPEKHILGEGGNARVYEAMWEGAEVAVKLGPKHEGELAESLNHPRIIRTYKYIPVTETDGCLVMEKVHGGNLSLFTLQSEAFDLEWCQSGGATEICVNVAKRLVQQILSGVQYMHSKKVAHRDLKLENVMLIPKDSSVSFKNMDISSMQVEDFNAKIIDFGLAKPIIGENQHEDCKGTPGYMAPESFMSFAQGGSDNAAYSKAYSLKAADIFAVGKIFENILTVENSKFMFIPNGYAIQAEFLNQTKANVPTATAWPVKYGRQLVTKQPDFADAFWETEHVVDVATIVQGLQAFTASERMSAGDALKLLRGGSEWDSSEESLKDVHHSSPYSSPGFLLRARNNTQGSPRSVV